MNLSLDRPIAFIDLETTGLNPSFDRIVELSALKVHPDGSEEVKSVRVNPEMPISAGATRVHGIKDADVAGEPTFRQYAKNLMAFLDGCDLSGFGKYRGRLLKDVAKLDGEYLNWVIYESDFTDQVKQVVREAVKP